MKLRILPILGLLCCSFSLFAQEDCAKKLKAAQKQYDDGVIEPVPELIKECLEVGFTKEEKVQALKLICLVYLFEDDNSHAEETMLKLLKLEPEILINPKVDNPEFVELFQKFRTVPLFSIGGFVGANFSMVSVSKQFSVGDINNSEAYYRNDGVALFGGFESKLYLFKNGELNLDFILGQNKFQYIDSTKIQYANVTMREAQTCITAPLTFTYDFNRGKKIIPFVRIGGSFSMMLSSSGEVVRGYSRKELPEVTGPKIAMTDLRNKFNYYGVIGAGFKYKLKQGAVIFDARYNYGMQNQVNVRNRYTNPELMYQYYYIDSDFTLNNITASVGYIRFLYKPKKLKVRHADSEGEAPKTNTNAK